MKNSFIRFSFIFLGILLCFPAEAQLPNQLSPADKVYGLSVFWQEVNYNFVYRSKIDQQKWDSTYRSLIDQVQRTENDYEYYRLMKLFCAQLKDGHTNIDFPNPIQKLLFNTMFGEFRLFIENIEHKAIVTHINLSQKDSIPVGSEIISVNHLPVSDYLSRFVTPYISSSTKHVLEDLSVSNIFQGLEGEEYLVKFKRTKGDTIELLLKHSTSTDLEVYPPFEKNSSLMKLEWKENQIAYLQLNSFQDPAIDSMFLSVLPSLYNAKGLIIDLRNNGGGNGDYGLDILQYLIPDKKVLGAKSRTRQHISAYKAWGEMTSVNDTSISKDHKLSYLNYVGEYYYEFPSSPRVLKPKHKRLVVPTVVLIGHKTASAAEDFLIYSDQQKHFTKMGSLTFGSTGQPYYFLLPGGAQARVCTKQDLYPDGKEFVGVGIVPDIFLEPTLDDFLNGTDSVLEKAIQYLQDSF